ncbi:MAG: hypothetical protein Tsb004_15650 [Allomuricauda sp.]
MSNQKSDAYLKENRVLTGNIWVICNRTPNIIDKNSSIINKSEDKLKLIQHALLKSLDMSGYH